MKDKHFATAFIILTLLISTGVMISSGRAAGDPDERFKGYNLEKENWTTGNLGKDYFEGGFVSYLLRISKDSKLWDAPSFDISYNFHQDSSDAVYIDGFDTSISPTGFQYAPDGDYLPWDEQDTSLATGWNNIPVPEATGDPEPATIFIDNYMDAWPIGDPEIADERYFTIKNIPWEEANDHMFFFFRAHLALDVVWWNGDEENLPKVLDGDEFESYGIGPGVLHGASFATGSSRHFYLQVPGVGAKTIPIPIAQYPDTLINGHKYYDHDGDGPEGTNTPIDDWEITLSGDLVLFGTETIPLTPKTVHTGDPAEGWDTGYYEFTGLITGEFELDEEEDPGYTHTDIVISGEGYSNELVDLPNGIITFDLLGGYTTTIDFYNVEYGSISGHKWEDLDGDGEAGDEDPIENWAITLEKYDETGSVWDYEDDTVTIAGGYYEFLELTPGDYRVVEASPAGWTHTDPATSPNIEVSLGAGEDSTDNDFWNFEDVTISGHKWEDLDGDGEAGDEDPIENWAITLEKYDETGSVWVSVDATSTDAGGYYAFIVDSGGDYRVMEESPTGWTHTDPLSSPYIEVLDVVSGEDRIGNDFWNFENVKISGHKWEDLDIDGIEDAEEDRLAGWVINLYKSDGAGGWSGLIDSDTTDAFGDYEFSDLGPGTYKVEEVDQTGWVQSFPLNGGYHQVTVTSGTDVTDKDFGNFQPKIELTVCTTYDSYRESVTYMVTVRNPMPTYDSLTDLTGVTVDSTIPGTTNPLLTVAGPLSAGDSEPLASPYTYTFTSSEPDPFVVTFTAEGYDADGDLVTVEITVSVDK